MLGMKVFALMAHLKRCWLPLFLIALVAAVAYSNIYDVPFAFDGKGQIEEKTKLRDLKGFLSPKEFHAHRPLVELTFALNYKFGRHNAFGYHLVNVVIHISNGFLVYYLALMILRQLTSSTPHQIEQTRGHRTEVLAEENSIPQASIPFVALIAALIFVVHPLQTQAVTYTTQRYASMAAMFYFLSTLFYIKARSIQQKAGMVINQDRTLGYNLSVVGCFFLCFFSGMLAFLSKQNAASLPGAILLVEYLLFDRTVNGWKRKLMWFAPAFVLMGVFILYVSGIFKDGIQFGRLLEDVSDILSVHGREISPWIYLCTQFNVLVIYLRLLFFPVGQNIDYLYPLKDGFFDGFTPLAFLLLAGIVCVGIWNVRKRPIITFGIFWFFITLSVESSVFPIEDALFEHRLYLPMFGFTLMVGYLIFYLLRNRRIWAIVISVCIVTSLGGATYLRNRIWQNGVTLWSDVISKSPWNPRAHVNLGFYLNEEGNYDEAIRHFSEALRIKPDFAWAHNNLGVALRRQGKTDDAITHYAKAVKIRPTYAKAHNNLGEALAARGDINDAIGHYEKALKAKPEYAEAYNNRGIAYADLKKYNQAIQDYDKAIELNPKLAPAHNNRGIVYANLKQYDQAIQDYDKAVELDPNYARAYVARGLVYILLLKLDRACVDLKKACDLGVCDALDFATKKGFCH